MKKPTQAERSTNSDEIVCRYYPEWTLERLRILDEIEASEIDLRGSDDHPAVLAELRAQLRELES